VAVIPGNAFGNSGEGFVRMCYASSLDNITEALARLGRFLDRLD
jgi:aminotransferase